MPGLFAGARHVGKRPRIVMIKRYGWPEPPAEP